MEHKDVLIARSFFLDMGKLGHLESLMEVSGIDFEGDTAELTQVIKGKSDKLAPLKTVGAIPLKAGKLTVKYLAFKDDPLQKWREKVINTDGGEMPRENISLILYDAMGEEKLRFNFARAWPSKRAFNSLSAKSSEALTVTITLEHEGVSVQGYNS